MHGPGKMSRRMFGFEIPVGRHGPVVLLLTLLLVLLVVHDSDSLAC